MDINNLQIPSIINKKKYKEISKLNFKKNYWKVMINILLIGILIIASINWTLDLYNYNLITIINNSLNNFLKIKLPFNKIIYFIICIIAIYISIKRETWLPFLGETILPSIFIPLKIPTNYNKTITIKTEPNSKIIYWASLPHTEIPDVSIAYEDYSNSGCVLSNNLGEANLYIMEGSSYTVPFNKEINKHIHYRVFNNNNNMLSEVYTIYY